MRSGAARGTVRLAGDLVGVDVGNSKTLVVLFRGGREAARWRLDESGLDPRRCRRAVRAVAADLAATAADLPVVVASVAPRRAAPLLAALRHQGFSRVHVASWRDRWPFAVDLRRPASVGADRLANVAGLMALGAHSGLAIDAGTAVTIDVLDAGRLVGGLIVPGFDLSLAALHRHTEKLPRLEMRGSVPLLGRETAGALRSGVYHATRLGIAAVVRALTGDRAKSSSRVVVTGSGGLDLLPVLPPRTRFEPDLLLLGLRTLAPWRPA